MKSGGLHNLISKQKQGTIEVKEVPDVIDGNPPIKIAIEYCASTGKSSGTFGTNASMINTGAWETHPQPHLPKSYNDYNCLYRFGFQFKNFRFISELLKDSSNSDIVWFITPYNKEFGDNFLVISDVIKPSIYWQRDIYNISIKNDKLKNLLSTFKENKIFYANDMTGTDFKQVIDFIIRR